VRGVNVRRPERRRALMQLAMLGAGAAAWPLAMAAGQRLVSVGGALTEIVYALQAGADLVGVDTTSLYPALAQKLPSVGYARALSAEGVLALAPTQVIATEDAGPPTVMRQLAAAGVPVAVLAANHRFEGLLERVKRVGEITGRVAQAERLAQTLRQDWARTGAQVAGRAQTKPPRVLFVLAHSTSQIMVAGRDTSAEAVIAYAGAVNAITGVTGYRPLTPEAVIAAQPDVVLVTDQGLAASGGIDGILKIPGIGQTPAGRGRRVLSFEAMFLLGFGPRLPAAVAALDSALNANANGARA
jgi:iron complex transport system substrate-binding protein